MTRLLFENHINGHAGADQNLIGIATSELLSSEIVAVIFGTTINKSFTTINEHQFIFILNKMY